MTRSNYLKTNKSKLVLIFLLIGILCLSLFGVACSSSSSDSDEPTYTYTEKDDGIISNPYFTYGTVDVKLTSFPKTSITGWSRSNDSNAKQSSSAPSGAINVSDEGWTELLNTLYSKDAILNFAGISKSDAKEAIKEEKGDDDYTPTDAEIKEYIIDNAIKVKFANPHTHDGAKDNMVYMLNNYLSSTYQGTGTSQKITSSTEVTLNKGEYAKISVWMYTANLNDFGASLRINSNFNGTAQSEFAIYNIDTNGAWKQYSVYVKADDEFATTFKLALGLGYSLNYGVEGTVYFDDVKVEHLTVEKFNQAVNGKNQKLSSMVYDGEDGFLINADNISDNDYVLYDLDLDTSSYLDDVAFGTNDITANVTTSSEGPAGNGLFKDTTPPSITELIVSDQSTQNGKNAIKITVDKASYTLNLKNSAFALASEKYAYIEFYVKNELDKFGSTSITFNVIDKLGNAEEVRTSVATISEVNDEWQKVSLVIKNNFDKDVYTDTRTFDIQIVVGPTDVSSLKYAYEYASGNVTITTPTIATGKTYQYEDNGDETANYNLYQLFSGTATATTALYAGLNNDYTDSSDTESYSFTTSKSDVAQIINSPARVSGYQGIVANHFYIKEDQTGLSRDIDTRTGDGVNGSYAGLINTKYLNNYTINGLASALSFTPTDDEKNIQPIMIYNNTLDSYGFIGQSKTISSSSYAKVSVTLRVYDVDATEKATAYVYLVDVSETEKKVMTFNDFTDNKGTNYLGKDMQLALAVDSTMMTSDGWVTVDFFVATGTNAKTFRVEVWNGSRDEVAKSRGFVFVKNINVSTSGAFSEPTKWEDTFAVSGNPLYTEVKENGQILTQTLLYKRALTDIEKQYNKEQSESSKIISYAENYVWAKNSTMIYAIYNTIDPVEVDPYDSESEDDTTSSGCTAETDPSTFWLSFSSILLGVALILAIIMLFIKNIRRRRKANRSDAKSHYKVTSRVRPQKKSKQTKDDEVEEYEEEYEEEVVEDAESDVQDENEQEDAEQTDGENDEKSLDDYVYGDVEVFGEEENKD